MKGPLEVGDTMPARGLVANPTDPFAAAVLATRMPMTVTDPRRPDNPIVFANDAFCRLAGYPRAEIIGRNCRFLQCPETDRDAVRRLREAIAAARPLEIELRNRRANGDLFWNRLLVAPVFDADGQLTNFFASQMDVTVERERVARLETEAARRGFALADSEQRFRAIAEASPNIVFVTDAAGENTYTSPQFTRYTGLPPNDLMGERWADVIHPEDRPRVIAAWNMSVATGVDYDIEFRMGRHDGAWRWFLARAVPLRDADGSAITRWCGTVTDIEDQVEAREALARGREDLERLVAARTVELSDALDALHAEAAERARAEEALRQSQKMEAIGQLTGGVAHDVNNLLTAISGSLELLQSQLARGRAHEAPRYIDVARKAVERGAALTHRLLAFARRQTLDPRPVDADQLVAGLIDLLQRAVGPRITLRTDLDARGTAVLCDANQLESALLNLAINARDAMPEGGEVVLATALRELSALDLRAHDGAEPGHFVEISVRDTGIGMPPDVLARAFDPFFTTKPVGQGTGLGLSQTYGFVRQSGGIVLLDSVVGQGTLVRLFLPIDAEMGDPHGGITAAAADRPPGEATGAVVMVVEDEEALRFLLVESLEELGCRVISVGDGRQARTLLEAGGRLDMLVTDVGLPGADGRELASVARRNYPGLPTLFITGYAGEALTDVPDGPGVAVISKPFQLAALSASVSTLLRERS